MAQSNRVFQFRLLRTQAVWYGLLYIGLLSTKLTSILHAESSAVVAGFGCCIAGLTAFHALDRRASISSIVTTSFVAALVPLAGLTLSRLWVSNCAYSTGLGIYILFVFPSILFAIAVASALYRTKTTKRRLIFVGIVAFVTVVPTIFTLKFFPQFFVYNHVYGGVLGPVYEDELPIRFGLIVFRLLTLGWSYLLFSYGMRLTSRSLQIATAIAIGVIYLAGGIAGIRGSSSRIASELGGKFNTDHFELFFQSGTFDLAELEVLGLYHEFHFQRLQEELGIAPAKPISVYIYPNTKVKAALTGAGTTSVAPVWLQGPQLHILRSELIRSLDHELVHVFSREFGRRFTNATTKIGLVEGLAVALEKPDAQPDLDAQVRVLLSDSLFVEDYDDDRIAKLISSPLFWLNRGAIAYSVSGSFTRWLLNEHPTESFRSVYEGSSFVDEYEMELPQLVSDWRESILALPVDSAALDLGKRRFAVPSLFEEDCPHHIPPYRRAYTAALDLHRKREWDEAEVAYQQALTLEPRYQQARSGLARLLLQQGRTTEAVEVASMTDSLKIFALQLVTADAQLAGGRFAEADSFYGTIAELIPTYASNLVGSLASRMELASAGYSSGVFDLRPSDTQTQRTVIPDSLATAYRLVQAEGISQFDKRAAVDILQSALDNSTGGERALIEARLSSLYFWTGRYGDAETAAAFTADYYREVRNDALTKYYDYLASLSAWAIINKE